MRRATDLAVVGACACLAIAAVQGRNVTMTGHPDAAPLPATVRASLASPPAPPPVALTDAEERLGRRDPARWQRPAAPRLRAEDLTAELIESCMVAARDIDPALAERLQALQLEDDDGFRQTLLRSRRLLSLAELRERDPGLYELKLIELRADAEVERLAAEYRAALEGESLERERIERELRNAIRLQMGFGLRAREDYLCRLQEIVARLEREMEYDKAHFDELVEQRLRACRDEGGPPPFGSDPTD